MIRTISYKNIVKIKNNHFELWFDKSRGGTLIKYICNKKDTNLYREGSEIWLDDSKHYEQEFSETCLFEFSKKTTTEVNIIVMSDLVCPKTKEIGGQTVVTWYIDESPFIKSSHIITAGHLILKDDRYVCFKANSYDKGTIIDRNGKTNHIDIEKNVTKGEWKRYLNDNSNILMLKNKDITFYFSTDSRLNEAGIYHSHSMLELKIYGEYEKETTNLIFGAINDKNLLSEVINGKKV